MSSNDDEVLASEIRRKLALPEDRLLAELGESLGKGATFTDSVRRGRQVLENLNRDLQAAVCSNPVVIKCYKVSKTDEVGVIAIIANAIIGSIHGIAPVTVAVLLYRMGLAKYCGPGWPDVRA
jgi:hypothetical protein